MKAVLSSAGDLTVQSRAQTCRWPSTTCLSACGEAAGKPDILAHPAKPRRLGRMRWARRGTHGQEQRIQLKVKTQSQNMQTPAVQRDLACRGPRRRGIGRP